MAGETDPVTALFRLNKAAEEEICNQHTRKQSQTLRQQQKQHETRLEGMLKRHQHKQLNVGAKCTSTELHSIENDKPNATKTTKLVCGLQKSQHDKARCDFLHCDHPCR